jgi:hypothetical protein
MPKKPIKQGYKIYGITDHGYVYNWLWSSREKGLQNIVYLYLDFHPRKVKLELEHINL